MHALGMVSAFWHRVHSVLSPRGRESARRSLPTLTTLAPPATTIADAWQFGAQLPPLVEENQPTATLLSGDQLARRLGQGLDFEQLRAYQPGEPAAMIDWRISARASEPLVRIYREPAQRQCHLIIDTGTSMLFGTRHQLKITQAFTAAHLFCAAALRQGMSVILHTPALVLRAPEPPSTSRAGLMQQLATLAELSADRHHPADAGDWVGFRQRLQSSLAPGQVIIVLSDFQTDFVAERGPLEWLPLAQRHRVVFLQIADPVERNLPDLGAVVFAGEPPHHVDTHRPAEREQLARLFTERQNTLRDTAQALGGWYALVFTHQPIATLTQHIALAQRGGDSEHVPGGHKA